MGIGWMWHVTQPHGPQGPQGLQAQNAFRAARFHARWRAVCGWIEARVERRTRRRRERALQRTFGRHPEALLRDVGLQRGVAGRIGVVTPDPAPVSRRPGPVLRRCATCGDLPGRAVVRAVRHGVGTEERYAA